ncbi:pantoate--beta-alanine ligase [Evansella halocellulosilytica]|uniref:pantoate--beta-alanine ligase n=1 Tax=Evansella halocellulosilytica TaxID=2011013 RepID=UPI000BB69A58|nr:pantoate--beta-alanine ligase [Evansella halocellulosilytica]
MIVVSKIKQLKQIVNDHRAKGLTIGFVPTMGYLHEGHLSLISRARQENDVVIASIFVNPLQFGENEDYHQYPRNLSNDQLLAKNHGVDLLFVPTVKEMYPKPMKSTIVVHEGVDVLCGESRPGHFDGVATVVMKLFQLTKANKAYFGMKDAQQVAIIENMVQDFHIDVEIIRCQTIRENDGLAKSSRNVNLTDDERAEAPFIYECLQIAKKMIIEGTDPIEVLTETKDQLYSRFSGKVDYVEVRTFPDLHKEIETDTDVIIAIAVKYSHVRLIDNVVIEAKERLKRS